MSRPNHAQSTSALPDDGEDVLTPLAPTTRRHHSDAIDEEGVNGDMTPLESCGPEDTHLKTYTAGEDGSRLATMAKEFGLMKQRPPRKQVRAPATIHTHQNYKGLRVLFEPTVEDARMRAVWTSHSVLEESEREQERQLYARMRHFSLTEGEGYEEELAKDEKGEEEIDAHAQGLGGNLTSAVLGIIKGMVGPAILYLPHGFANAGYMSALPLLIFATIMYLYSSRCLLDAWKIESESSSTAVGELAPLKRPRRIMLSYPELAYRALGPTGETMVKTGIALMQSGVCLTYLIFVPQNLATSFGALCGWHVAPEWWLLVMVVLQIPLSWIRDIRKLTITNLLANLLILYGLLTCLGFSFSSATTSDKVGPIASIWEHLTQLLPFQSDWFLFIGTSVLLFEGSITLLVPLQESVHSQADRELFPKVYRNTILGIMLFYTVFGMTCWMAFGDNVRTVFTTSLPEGYLAASVQVAYSIAVIFTFPLQNFPALEIATKTIGVGVQKNCVVCSREARHFWTQRNVLSSLLVCLLALVAVMTMDSLDKVVSLMGALLGCPIAFLFPPLIHSRLAQGGVKLTPGRKLCNNIVAFLGVVAMVLASITTIIAW